MELTWNTRYERSKAALVHKLEAVMRLSSDADRASAERAIAAVKNLPVVDDVDVGLEIENRAAKRPGDANFVYSLSLSESGFSLSYVENTPGGGALGGSKFVRTFVSCEPVECEPIEESEDDEALGTMREWAEEQFGRPIDDQDWDGQVEDAVDTDTVPNGIETWLEMLPVEDDGSAPDTLSIRWNSSA